MSGVGFRLQSGRNFGGYKIERRSRGLMITGPIPVDDLEAIVSYAGALGYDWINAVLTQRLGVTMVITSHEEGEASLRELEKG